MEIVIEPAGLGTIFTQPTNATWRFLPPFGNSICPQLLIRARQKIPKGRNASCQSTVSLSLMFSVLLSVNRLWKLFRPPHSDSVSGVILPRAHWLLATNYWTQNSNYDLLLGNIIAATQSYGHDFSWRPALRPPQEALHNMFLHFMDSKQLVSCLPAT